MSFCLHEYDRIQQYDSKNILNSLSKPVLCSSSESINIMTNVRTDNRFSKPEPGCFGVLNTDA